MLVLEYLEQEAEELYEDGHSFAVTPVKEIKKALLSKLPSKIKPEDLFFLCIGTDRSTGDSLGPFVGTLLKEKGYDVAGTLTRPVHAKNLINHISKLPKDKVIVAIDSALGTPSLIGKINVSFGSLKPGLGVAKDLPEVGDYSIKGVVNFSGFAEFLVLQNTRLGLVLNMAKRIVAGIEKAYPIKKKRRSYRCLF